MAKTTFTENADTTGDTALAAKQIGITPPVTDGNGDDAIAISDAITETLLELPDNDDDVNIKHIATWAFDHAPHMPTAVRPAGKATAAAQFIRAALLCVTDAEDRITVLRRGIRNFQLEYLAGDSEADVDPSMTPDRLAGILGISAPEAQRRLEFADLNETVRFFT